MLLETLGVMSGVGTLFYIIKTNIIIIIKFKDTKFISISSSSNVSKKEVIPSACFLTCSLYAVVDWDSTSSSGTNVRCNL